MKKRIIPVLLVLAVLLTALVPIAASADKTVKYVYTRNSKPLNVRSWPSINADLLGTLPNGKAVTVENYTADYIWAVITYNGRTAYVMTQYLVDASPSNSNASPSSVDGSPDATAAQSAATASKHSLFMLQLYRIPRRSRNHVPACGSSVDCGGAVFLVE